MIPELWRAKQVGPHFDVSPRYMVTFYIKRGVVGEIAESIKCLHDDPSLINSLGVECEIVILIQAVRGRWLPGAHLLASLYCMQSSRPMNLPLKTKQMEQHGG